MTVKDYGAGVSGFLEPEGRNFETTVYQASKPVLDKELNLVQDTGQARVRPILQLAQSGWLSGGVLDSADPSEEIFSVSAVANELIIPPLTAIVNGWHLKVEDGPAGNTLLDLGAGPAGAGAKRTDLVILEVWRRLISPSPSTDGKSGAGNIWYEGNVKTSSEGDNFADTILDGGVAAETTKRVQIQYRLRVIQDVDLNAYPFGISDPSAVFGHSVPVSAASPDGTVTAFTYAHQSASGDAGLWRAGDGVPANALGTVDGYVYALPLMAVFRRNTTAFDRDTNHNGGVATPGPSDRPDGLFHDILNVRDVFDLRNSVSTTGWDFQELLTKNANLILDNTLRTEQEDLAALGGGMRGHTNLWADEIGPTDNPGAEQIRTGFDGVARRFSDRHIIEKIIVRYQPDDKDGGGADWSNGVRFNLTIDPTGVTVPFRIWPSPSANFLAAAPSEVRVLDVLLAIGQAGNSLATLAWYNDPATGAYFVSAEQVTGLGTQGPLVLSAGVNEGPVGTGDMYMMLLISYPSGTEASAGGLTRHPVGDFGSDSFVLETPAQLPAGSPYFFASTDGDFDTAHREVRLQYRTTSITRTAVRITSFLNIPADHYMYFLPDRVADSPTPTATNTTGGNYTGAVTLSSDGYFVFLSSLSGDWSNAVVPAGGVNDTDITYQTVRPIPNNSVQYTIWYETAAAQTIRTALLGTTLTVIPRYVAPYLYTLASGSGAIGEAFPFPQQHVQSPGVYPTSGGTFSGDAELDGFGAISISNFDAETGFLQVPTLIPAVPEPQSLTFTRVGGDVDAEGRSFFKEVPAGYIPSAFGQPLSNDKRHKNILPMIAELAVDGPIGPKGTLVIVMISRWAEFDSNNGVGFNPDLALNYTSASVYRLKGNPLASRRS